MPRLFFYVVEAAAFEPARAGALLVSGKREHVGPPALRTGGRRADGQSVPRRPHRQGHAPRVRRRGGRGRLSRATGRRGKSHLVPSIRADRRPRRYAAIKAHPTRSAAGLLDAGTPARPGANFRSLNPLCGGRVDKVIMLVRHPVTAFWSASGGVDGRMPSADARTPAGDWQRQSHHNRHDAAVPLEDWAALRPSWEAEVTRPAAEKGKAEGYAVVSRAASGAAVFFFGCRGGVVGAVPRHVEGVRARLRGLAPGPSRRARRARASRRRGRLSGRLRRSGPHHVPQVRAAHRRAGPARWSI